MLISFRDNFKYYSILIASKNILFTYISMIFDLNYLNEHKAVLKGAVLYNKSIKNNVANIYFLRRNLHRIEKGLLMQPFREEFGLRFIKGTVDNFILLSIENHPDIYSWGNDILSEYFRVTVSNDQQHIVSKIKYNEYRKLINIENDNTKVPYHFDISKNTVNFEEFENMMHTRKSVRWFSTKAVEQTKIEKALDVARLSPASCNRQPYRYIITTIPKKAQYLASISGGTGGWGDNLQAIAILVGRQRTFSNSDSRHLIYIDSTLTVMPFILSLQSLNLSSCIINWVDMPSREKQMRAALNLDDDEKVIMSIAIGYNDKERKVAYSARMPAEQVGKFI
jgi:nitroreductase